MDETGAEKRRVSMGREAKAHPEKPNHLEVGNSFIKSDQQQGEKDAARLKSVRELIIRQGPKASAEALIPPEPQEEPLTPVGQPRKPSRIKNHLRKYQWRILSAIPLERTRAAAVREQITWAKEVDDLHPPGEPLLPQGILNITEKSRGTIDEIIRQKTSDNVEFSGKTVALSTVVREGAEQRLSVAVERISEPNGPCYIAYEILEDKITGEAVVLSHGMIDTDIGDKSDVSSRIRTECSWRQKRLSSTEYPRASAIIFNALTEYVLKKRYKTDPNKVILAFQSEKKPTTQLRESFSGKEQEPSKPKVSIVVLNWNGLTDTEECLQSLERISYPNAQVIVVDNDSTDNSVQEIKKRYPGVRLIENKDNMGFCEGNNIGIREALEGGSDYVLILNNDTIVEPDFIEGLVRVAEKNPAIGAVIPKIICLYDQQKIWFAGHRGAEGYSTYMRPNTGLTDWSRPSDAFSGCAALVRREAFEQIGLFDPRFFFAFEDVDLSVRFKAGGFRIHYTPESIVYHKSGESASLSETAVYYRTRNLALLKETMKPQLPSILHKYVATIGSLLPEVSKCLIHGNFKSAGAALEGYRDYLRGKFGRRGTGMDYLG